MYQLFVCIYLKCFLRTFLSELKMAGLLTYTLLKPSRFDTIKTVVVAFSTILRQAQDWCAYSNWDCTRLSLVSLLISVMKPKTKFRCKDRIVTIEFKINFLIPE